MTDNCGIYKIKDNCSGKIYIGSSCNLKRRKNSHFCELRRNNHANNHMQRVFNKSKNFEFEILIICRRCDLLFYEQLFIDFLKPQLNQSKIAGRTEMTEEVRKKISIKKKGVLIGKGRKNPKLSAFLKERKRPRQSELLTGRKRSEFAKQMLGNKNAAGARSEETRKKNSAARQGKRWSEKIKKKMSESAKLRWERERKSKETTTSENLHIL